MAGILVPGSGFPGEGEGRNYEEGGEAGLSGEASDYPGIQLRPPEEVCPS